MLISVMYAPGPWDPVTYLEMWRGTYTHRDLFRTDRYTGAGRRRGTRAQARQ